MNDTVSRTERSNETLLRTSTQHRQGSQTEFNSTLSRALNGPKGSRTVAAAGPGSGKTQPVASQALVPGQFESASLLKGGNVNGVQVISAGTQKLVDDAVAYDRDGQPDAAESAKRWNAVQNAIAVELRQMAPNPNAAQDQAQPLTAQFTPEQVKKVEALNALSLGNDALARETGDAIQQIDTEINMGQRSLQLHSLRSAVDGKVDAIEAENDDHNIFRKGWDSVTGGGAGDDFEDYLKGKAGELQKLDQTDETLDNAEYAKRLNQIMSGFDVQVQQHIDKMAESDETWNTVGEVGRVVTATTVGILATVGTGGNLAVGFGAALGTYELIDVGNDIAAASRGESVYADGHAGITTGLVDLAGGIGDVGMSGEDLKVWAKDNSLDAISSLGTTSATFAGMRTSAAINAKIAAGSLGTRLAGSQLGTRILATTAGGTAAQGVNGVSYLAADATHLGFEGKLFTAEGGDQMLGSLKTQGTYLAAAAPTSAVAGWIPLYRVMPGRAGGAPTTPPTGPAQPDPLYRLNYLGLTGQFANDATSNFGTAYLVDGEISKADAIGALGGMVPSTIQNVAIRPDTQQRIETWRNGQRDLRFTSWTGFPPDKIKLPPVTGTVLTLRGLLQGVDATTGLQASKITNDMAVPLTTVRSSLSKFAWFRGNHRLIDVYDRALQGDREAITLFRDIEEGRGWFGIKVKDSERAATGDSARMIEVKALVDLGVAYKNARARLPQDQQALLPDLSIRKLTSPEAFLARLQQDETLPADVRNTLAMFHPDARLLSHSNVVEGLLTDPEFLVNAIDALGVKLKPEDTGEIRDIFNTQKLLETDVRQGGYNNMTAGGKWSDLTWLPTKQGGTTKPGIFDHEVTRLDDYIGIYLRSKHTGTPATDDALKGLLDSWKNYALYHSEYRNGDTNRIVDARARYEGALNSLPPGTKDLFPASRGGSPEAPGAILTRLRQDQGLPVELRQALGDFEPNTHLLDNPITVRQLLNKPQLLESKVQQFKDAGKLNDAQFDSIHLIMDLHNRLKADATAGGYDNLQHGTTWNELGWRPVRNPGQQSKPGVFDEEVARLDRVVQDFLTNQAPKDANGNPHPEVKGLLDTWKTYMGLYSQTQHDLAASDYRPGINHRGAEQKLGSSASPDTKYGYMLKAAAYGVAVNLVYSWMQKPRPATDGFVQGALNTAYAGEATLALYNLWGQIGYMKALGAMTEFKGKYKTAQYTPSDKPEDMAVFDPALHREFKNLEARRKRWNLVSDLGSSISAVRNTAMGVAFASVGLPSVAGMYFTNAALSVGWLAAQRTPGFAKGFMTPEVKGFFRWSSIIGGPILQTAAVVQAWRMAEEIGEKQGPQGDSVVDDLEQWLSNIIDGLEDEPVDLTDVYDRRSPLPDRA